MNGIDDRLQHPAVTDIGAHQRESEGDALRAGEHMTLRTRFAPIEAPSREARLETVPFWQPSRSSRAC